MRKLMAGLMLLMCALPVVAQRTRAAKAAPTATTSTAEATTRDWVASSKGKTYYRAGCAGARKLAAKNLIYFKSEEEAKKAGYARSRQRGC